MEIDPRAVAAIDQRIAHGQDILALIVGQFRERRERFGVEEVTAQCAVMLNEGLTDKSSAIDLLAVAIAELAKCDRHAGKPSGSL